MSNVASSRNKINLAETQYLAGLNESMASRFAAAINWIIDNITNPAVGTITPSMMTLAQFQAVKGTTWVLADGQAVPGTLYESQIAASVPDLRGYYLRGKNNGRGDGLGATTEIGLGVASTHNMKQHTHTTSFVNYQNANALNLAHSNNTRDQAFNSNEAERANPFLFTPTVTISTPITNTGADVSTETRPSSVVVNFFIKVN